MLLPLPFTPTCSALASLVVVALVAAQGFEPPAAQVPLPPQSVPSSSPVESPAHPQAVIPVEVIRVIDGDTIEVKAHVWLDQMIITRVRLRSIDAPEMRAKCPEEARRAAASQEALIALLHGGRAYLTSLARDKYGGRVLGELLTLDGHTVSQTMLTSGHARPYAGGRRQGWC
jgi:micrococcal nuclease